MALWQKSFYLTKIHQSLVYSNIRDIRCNCILSLCDQIAIKNCVKTFLKNILRNRLKKSKTVRRSNVLGPHYQVKTYSMNVLLCINRRKAIAHWSLSE